MARIRGPGVSAMLVLAAAAIIPAGRVAADEPLPIGRSVVVVSDVEGRIAEAPPKQIAVNEDVVFEEDILTGDAAKTVIEFRDGSVFEVGPNSAVRIDSFVFNPDESVSRKAVEVGRGVFRYVSGLAAADQDTRITTTSGTLAIRGSVVAGIAEPDVPIFLYVGEGQAVFTNDAGSTAMAGGGAIAVPSRTTTPVRPAAMPAAIVAQALHAIDRRLPSAAQLRHGTAAGDAWLRQAGVANLSPTAEQARREAAAGRRGPLTASGGASRLSREVNLLVEGNRRNLFDGAETRRTPEQQAFLREAARAVPHAAAAVARSRLQAAAMHRAQRAAAAGIVMRGIAAASPSPEIMRRVATAAAKANPSSASAIRQSLAGGRGHVAGPRERSARETHPPSRQRSAAAEKRGAPRRASVQRRPQAAAPRPGQPRDRRPREQSPR